MTQTRSFRRQGNDSQPILQFSILWQRVSLSEIDLASIVAFLAICGYAALFKPALLVAGGLACVCASSFWLLDRGIRVFDRRYRIPLKSWHVASFVLLLTLVVSSLDAGSVYAQFFQALEDATVDVINDGNTGIEEEFVRNIFLFFRILIILAFLVGVIVAFTAATRGNDWQPIANMLGIGFAFVIVVELVTNLMLGNTAGGGG